MEFIDFEPRIKTNEAPGIALTSQIQFIPSGEELVKLVHTTGDHLRKLTDSDGYIFYQMDTALRELFICPMESSSESCVTTRYRWKLDRSDTIAVYVYKNMTAIMVDANTSVDLNFPYLQALPNLHPRYILTIPIVNFQKRCFGVVEFYRNNGKQYSQVDVRACQFLLRQVAEAFKQNENAVFFKNFNHIQGEVQELMEKYEDDPYEFLSKVVELTRDYTHAMSSSMFFVKHGVTKRVINTVGVPCFVLEEEQGEKGQILRSIASNDFSTTIMKRRIHGMIKTCNKLGLPKFSILDEQLLNAFGKICKIWTLIEYSNGYLKKQKSLNEAILSLIHLQLQNAGDFGKKLTHLVPSDMVLLDSWKYYLDPSADSRKLCSEIVTIIKYVAKKGKLQILEEPLCDFVVMVEQCHETDDDVDFRSTVLSVQGLYRLLEGCKALARDKEAFAMIIACFSHNIAIHTEPTSVSPIFGRYNNYARELLRFEIVQFIFEETKLLGLLSEDERDEMLNLIKDFMVGLNLQSLKQNADKFSNLVASGKILTLELQKDPELRSLVLQIMPGVANVLGHFKSELFQKWFPNFSLFKYLEQNELTCVEIILAICPM